MSESGKTIGFLLFGVVLAGIALWVNAATQPNSETADLTGQPFFPDFESAEAATFLKVAAVDPEEAELQTFRVEEKKGLWRIPTHHDYPAEAADRLARTATSVLGILRESRASSNSAEHAKYGVRDPESFDPATADDAELAEFGKRITLRDASDEVLADFIIGREADTELEEVFGDSFEQEVGEKLYYVRRADEDRTYVVKLNIDLSTRFADWIDPDLLQVDASELRRIKVDNYELRARSESLLGGIQPMTRVQKGELLLTRETPADSWQLEGFDPETEVLVNNRIGDITSVVDELSIIGVRPKLTYKGEQLITADLQVNPIAELTAEPEFFQDLMNRLQDEMSANGFNFVNQDNQIKLVAQFGEVVVGTANGVVYRLLFGARVTGDETAIEIGGPAAVPEDESAEGTPAGQSDGSTGEDTTVRDDNRYLMVQVLFDPTLLGDAPEAPLEPAAPEAPEGYTPQEDTPNEEGDPAEGESSGEDTSGTGEETEEGGSGAPGSEQGETEERKPEFVEYERQLAEYRQAQTEYELAKTRYEDELKRYEEKVTAGRERVEELNQRFGQWYYVISASNLDVLQSQRDDLVQPKATDRPEPSQPEQPLPGRPDITLELPPELEQDLDEEPPAASGDRDASDGQQEETGKGEGNGNEGVDREQGNAEARRTRSPQRGDVASSATV